MTSTETLTADQAEEREVTASAREAGQRDDLHAVVSRHDEEAPPPRVSFLQYSAWGMLVSNTNLRGAHIANGLAQLLRLLPYLVQSSIAIKVQEDVTTNAMRLLKDHYPGWALRPTERLLCVTMTKSGALRDDEDQGVIDVLHAMDEHLGKYIKSPALKEEERGIIAGVLNADGRVYVKGGGDLSVASLRLVGFSSTHTLRSMHALTFLGALCATEKGAESLVKIYELFTDEADPHATLTERLGLGTAHQRATLSARALLEGRPFPLPEALLDHGEGDSFTRLTADLTSNLLSWSEKGAKADILSSLIELIGLLFVSNLCSWAETSVLLLCPTANKRRDAPMTAQAQKSWQRALHSLNSKAEDEAQRLVLTTVNKQNNSNTYLPGDAMRTLARVTGWLTPLDSRGGAKHHLGPTPRALTTLIRALVSPREELSWEELRGRARRLRLELGGQPTGDISTELSPVTLEEAARVNQETLCALGLARHESDDVIKIDAGGAL